MLYLEAITQGCSLKLGKSDTLNKDMNDHMYLKDFKSVYC